MRATVIQVPPGGQATALARSESDCQDWPTVSGGCFLQPGTACSWPSGATYFITSDINPPLETLASYQYGLIQSQLWHIQYANGTNWPLALDLSLHVIALVLKLERGLGMGAADTRRSGSCVSGRHREPETPARGSQGLARDHWRVLSRAGTPCLWPSHHAYLPTPMRIHTTDQMTVLAISCHSLPMVAASGGQFL